VGEALLPFLEVQEILVPGALVVVLLELATAFLLEEVYGLLHDLPGPRLGEFPVVFLGVHQYHRQFLSGENACVPSNAD
jgi:hypothetical protein